MAKLNVACVVVLFITQALLVSGKGDSYTAEELQILPKFLEKMKNELTQDYMFDNKYLIRFLRARQLNIDKAEEMLRNNLKWRKDNKLETILSEDFSWWEKRFPFYHPVGLDGRPALASGIGQMNFRTYVVSGKADRVMKYIYYAIERGLLNIRRVSNETGIEFINGHLLFNLAGYNAKSHACISCLPFWIDLAQNYENYYPQLANKFIVINVPRLFEFIIQLISPFLTPATQKSIRLYGYDREEWKRELLKIFPAETLTAEFGGTRKLSKFKP